MSTVRRHPNLWFYGYLPYKIAFGTLSILVPLFIFETLKGNFLDLGVVTATFNLASIPFVILWGWLSDKTGKRKFFITISFILTGITVTLFAFTTNILQFIILNIIQAIFFTIHQPATNMLIAEENPKNEWDEKIALYQLIAGVGWAVGLVVGAFWMVTQKFRELFLFSGFLCFATFILSLLLVKDPPRTIERKKVTVKRAGPSITERASFPIYWIHRTPHFRSLIRKLSSKLETNLAIFNIGVLIFSIAATMAFTPLPIFFKQKVFSESSEIIGIPPNTLVFVIFFINAIVCAVGYPIAGRWGEKHGNKRAIVIATASRLILFPALIACAILPFAASVCVASILLGLIGVTWALFAVSSTALSVELVSEEDMGESTGIYNASMSLGNVVGGALGGVLPYIMWSTSFGLEAFFLWDGLLFAVALTIFAKVKTAI